MVKLIAIESHGVAVRVGAILYFVTGQLRTDYINSNGKIIKFELAGIYSRHAKSTNATVLAFKHIFPGLPEMLIRQFEYEDPIVRGGKHLLHSPFFKELVALACDLQLDSLPCCSGNHLDLIKNNNVVREVMLFECSKHT